MFQKPAGTRTKDSRLAARISDSVRSFRLATSSRQKLARMGGKGQLKIQSAPRRPLGEEGGTSRLCRTSSRSFLWSGSEAGEVQSELFSYEWAAKNASPFRERTEKQLSEEINSDTRNELRTKSNFSAQVSISPRTIRRGVRVFSFSYGEDFYRGKKKAV